jgi:hypothetical protein
VPDAATRTSLKSTFRDISRRVDTPHNESHILTPVIELLRFRRDHPGVEGRFVEAGRYKGGSTAKLSIVAGMLDIGLTVFDSFEGIPFNTEDHSSTVSRIRFRRAARPGIGARRCGGLF